jgi:hypothetical protein
MSRDSAPADLLSRRLRNLEFGTELVTASDGSIVAMLGASLGASTAVWIMLIFNTAAVF